MSHIVFEAFTYNAWIKSAIGFRVFTNSEVEIKSNALD